MLTRMMAWMVKGVAAAAIALATAWAFRAYLDPSSVGPLAMLLSLCR